MSPKSLSVRTKILIALVVSVLVLYVAILGASYFVIQAGFATIEHDAMRQDVARLTDAVENSVNQELVSLKDWSTWDESYRFAKTKDPAFVAANLPDTALTNLNIELIAYFDTDGKSVFAKEIERATGEEVSHDATLAAIAADSSLTKRASEKDRLGGFVVTPRGILELGSLPLLQSTGEGPTTGSLIFARYFDTDRIKDLSDLLHLTLDAYPYDAANLPMDVSVAKRFLETGAPDYVAALSDSSIAGYTTLTDIHGTPILIFRITEPRPIHAQGDISTTTFIAIGGAALLLFGLVVVFFLERIIIARFVRLTERVEKINDTKDLSVKIEDEEMDEIGRLAEKIRQLLTWLSQSKEAEAAARREMLNLVNELKSGKEQEAELRNITGK